MAMRKSCVNSFRAVFVSARSKCDDQYHTSYDRSDFYSMLDLTTQPVLFNPVPDYEDYCITVSGYFSC